ncbi:MAG TPA: mandelate racemase/muconate lactonizing enzyme family protein [Opitutaceae bacterium]|nr:mandelate racemase/muconate lactonizing enzyme family protein [Opitutaceae bacterium]
MNLTRRNWLKYTGGAMLAASLPRSLSAANAKSYAEFAAPDNIQPYIRQNEQPMFDIPGQIKAPVKIASVEMLKVDNNFFVRTRSTDGAEGITGTKQVEDFIPMFQNLVAPHFVGKDARDIESLVDYVYRENYKLASIPLWCCIAYAEQSTLDLLGKVANKPVGALLGGVIRKEIPVYLSGSPRNTTPEEEVDVYVRGFAATGSNAVKFHMGGRMSRNQDTYPGRTETLLIHAREKLGDKAILMADANGSYDVPQGIRIGRLLESLNYEFFEEPCPFEELAETMAVAKALKIPIAFGEQNYSLWQFDWMLRNGVMQIVQPDINYNGGLIRAKRVAKIAERLNRTCVPHNTQTGLQSVNILQFASCTTNATPSMEYPWRAPQKAVSWYKPDFRITGGKIQVPTTPGMGLEIDPDYLKKATLISRADKPVPGGGNGTGN